MLTLYKIKGQKVVTKLAYNFGFITYKTLVMFWIDLELGQDYVKREDFFAKKVIITRFKNDDDFALFSRSE